MKKETRRREHLHTLREAFKALQSGYAKDLTAAFIYMEIHETKAMLSSEDAGDLFRTLVLDEGISVSTAKKVYVAASDLSNWNQ